MSNFKIVWQCLVLVTSIILQYKEEYSCCLQSEILSSLESSDGRNDHNMHINYCTHKLHTQCFKPGPVEIIKNEVKIMDKAAALDDINYHDIQTQCFSADSSENCINCVLMKDQLQSAILELKTANTIISLLREDINKATAREATNLPKPSLPGGSSKHEGTNVGWIPVVHNSSKGKKTPMAPSRTTEKSYKSYRSSNRFTPLPENLHHVVHPTSNHEWTSSSKATKESTNKPSTGYKIPTIVNERVINDENKKPVWTNKETSTCYRYKDQ